MNAYQRHTSIRLSFRSIVRLLLIRRTLRKRDTWTRAKLLEHQERSLTELRIYAYTRSRFYRRFHAGLEDKPLSELPILTKKDLMDNWNDIVTDNTLTIDDLRAFITTQTPNNPQLFRGEYVVSTTSGSTGLKGIFAFNRDEWLWGLASHGRITEWAKAKVIGLIHRPKLATVSSLKPWCKSLLVAASVDSPVLSSLRLDSTEPLHVISQRLNTFRPEILVAYAETAKALAQQKIHGDLAISPKTVFTSSEILTAQAKKVIKRAWGIEPFNAYAATEAALIAADCQYHSMHVCEDLVIVEVVDEHNRSVPPGTYGAKMLVTVLFSRTVPLIRYEISDSVAFSDQKFVCSCGKPFAILADIEGRVEDIMHLGVDSKRVAIKPDIFHDVLETAPVNGWQVTQESALGVVVSIVGPQAGYDEQEVIRNVQRRLQEQGVVAPVVRIEILEKLRQSASGKTPLVKALKR